LALSFKTLREPDLWWQLLTGDWILRNLSIPVVDIFSFTHSRAEWINVKWLFEVFQAIFYRLGGPELLYLMQSLVNLGILWFFWKIFKSKAESQTQHLLAFVLATILVFVGLDFRINGRPEMISHFFTATYLFLFLDYSKNKSKLIFWLIPLQALWTNFHEAYGVGMVLIATFALSENFESFKSQSKKLDKRVSIAALVSFAAIGLNPKGFYMLIHPLEIFGQVGANKFTTELYSFQTDYYWNQFEPYLAFGLLIIGLLSFSFPLAKLKKFFKNIISEFGLSYLLILAAFCYLALTAHRNLPFLLIWLFPLLETTLLMLTSRIKSISLSNSLAMVLCISMYLSVVSDVFYKSKSSQDTYGLGVSAIDNPIGAANYIQQAELKGPCFSDYLVSSFLLWDLRPNFKSFIDFRDLDIYSAEFFQAFNQMAVYPQDFEKFHKEYEFGYAVLNRIQFSAIHQYLLNREDWELAFADPVAVVFVNTNRNDINFDSPNLASRKNVFQEIKTYEASLLSKGLNKILNPLFESNTVDLNLDIEASLYFQSLGRYDLAVKRAQAAIEAKANDPGLYLSLGNSYLLWSSVQDNNSSKTKLLKKAFEAFNLGLNINAQNDEILQGIAQVQMNIGKAYDAMGSLKRAVKIKESSQAYALMAQCQNMLMQADPNNNFLYTKKWYEYMLLAHDLNPSDPILNFNLGVSYCQDADCEKAKPYLEKASYNPQLSQSEMNTLANCKKQCGLDA